MTTDEYQKIAWPDVQAGDVLMHENGDRLTVKDVSKACIDTQVGGLINNPRTLSLRGFSPYRKAEPVPTQPGAYLDKDGVLCVLTEDKDELLWWADVIDGGIYRGIEAMRHRAPFTRLVPMPTEADVRTAIDSSRISSGFLTDEATAAVMALFEQEVDRG